MGTLSVFNNVSLDGYFVDTQGDMSWAHHSDPEWDAFTSDNAQNADAVLLFGRKTYELMASYWPTPQALQSAPTVARGMNAAEKVVFSRTLKKATWNNTRLIRRGLASEIRTLKQASKKELLLMGSGTIVSQLSQEGLVDRYQLVVNPLVLGKGRSMFEGLKRPFDLKLADTRRFKNGNVLLTYRLINSR